MKTFWTCLLLSITPVSGFADVYTNTQRASGGMDHLLPFVIPQQGPVVNTYNPFFNAVCNGQLPSSSIGANVNASVEGHDTARGVGWDESQYLQISSEELVKSFTLHPMDDTKNAGDEMKGRPAINGIYMLPTASVFPFDLEVNDQACLARLVY